MQDEDAELGLGRISTHALPGSLDILLQLLNGILECRPGIINLVDNEDPLANKVLHRTKSSEIKPLGASDLGARLLNLVVAERLVKRQTNGLDGDVGRPRLPEERAQDASRDVTATADGDHELRLEVGQQLGRRLLAQLVHLSHQRVSATIDKEKPLQGYRRKCVTYIVVGNVDFLDHGGGLWLDGCLGRGTTERRARGRGEERGG